MDGWKLLLHIETRPLDRIEDEEISVEGSINFFYYSLFAVIRQDSSLASPVRPSSVLSKNRNMDFLNEFIIESQAPEWLVWYK